MDLVLPGAERFSEYLRKLGELEVSVTRSKAARYHAAMAYNVGGTVDDQEFNGTYTVQTSHNITGEPDMTSRTYWGTLPGHTPLEKPVSTVSGDNSSRHRESGPYKHALLVHYQDSLEGMNPDCIILEHTEILREGQPFNLQTEWERFLSVRGDDVRSRTGIAVRQRLLQYLGDTYTLGDLKKMGDDFTEAIVAGKRTPDADRVIGLLVTAVRKEGRGKIERLLSGRETTFPDFIMQLSDLPDIYDSVFPVEVKDDLHKEFLSTYMAERFSKRSDGFGITITNCPQIPFP